MFSPEPQVPSVFLLKHSMELTLNVKTENNSTWCLHLWPTGGAAGPQCGSTFAFIQSRESKNKPQQKHNSFALSRNMQINKTSVCLQSSQAPNCNFKYIFINFRKKSFSKSQLSEIEEPNSSSADINDNNTSSLVTFYFNLTFLSLKFGLFL